MTEELRFATNVLSRFDFITSSDLRRHAELPAIADWFVRTYEGTHMLIRDYQRVLFNGHRLSAHQERAALNIARAELSKIGGRQ